MIHNIQYISNVGYLKEYFYCTICFNKPTEHFCQLKEDKKTLVFCESCNSNIINKTRQQPWFTMNGEFRFTVTIHILLIYNYNYI